MIEPEEIVLCVVNGCTWRYTLPSVNYNAPLVMSSLALHAVLVAEANQAEADLREHLESHDVVDFARTIRQLRSRVDELERGGAL